MEAQSNSHMRSLASCNSYSIYNWHARSFSSFHDHRRYARDQGGPGVCSLRDAIRSAKPTGRLTAVARAILWSSASAGTIKLSERLFLSLHQGLSIVGPTDGITLDAQGRDQVIFSDESAITVTLQNLTIANGFTRNPKGGGGIFSAGPLG